MLKRLFWASLLALLLSTEAYAERGLQTLTNCDNYPDPETNASLCHQTTGAGGRTAGHVYTWDGKEWIDLASIAAPGTGDIEGVTAGTNLTGGGTSGTVTLNVADPLVGNVTGNASTATALAADPAACTAGQFVSDIAASGALTCGTPAGGGAGDIEGVTAGTNLTGGGTSGTVTLNVANPVVANLTGNASTATALAADGTNCASGQAPLGVDASGAVQGCFDVATQAELDGLPALDSDLTALANNANDGLWARTGTGTGAARTITGTANQITVTNGSGAAGNPTVSIPTNPTLPGTTSGTFSGPLTGAVTGNVTGNLTGAVTGNVKGDLTGNASTASALAANPTDCGGGQFANAIDASGNLTCATPPGGGGTGDIEGVTAGTNLTGGGTSGTVTLHVANPLVGNVTGNVTGSVTGNASTATALAANGANCAAGEVALGVTAAGAAEGCYDVALITEVTVATLPIGVAAGVTRTVTDGTNSSDCETGGGSDRVLCSYDGADWTSLGGGGTASTPTLDAIFDADATGLITGATEAKPLLISGNDDDYAVVIRVTTANSPEVVGMCAGVVGGCDRIFSHNAGKKTEFVDSDGTPEVSYTEDVGFTKLTIDAEAQGNVLYRDGTSWRALPPGTSGQFLQTQGAAANPQWASPTAAVKSVQVVAVDFTTATSTGDGKTYFRVPSSLNNYTLTAVQANVIAAGTTGTLNVDLARCAATTAGAICTGTGTSIADMLSTNLTIDSGENDSATAAAAAVINTTGAANVITTGQVIRVDIDAIHTTPATGLIVNMDFTAP